MISFFQIPARKYPNQVLLVPNLRILFLHQSLQQCKFNDVDSKYQNSVFKFHSKNRVWKAEILVPNLGISSFAQFAESDDINDIKKFENFDSFIKKFIHGSWINQYLIFLKFPDQRQCLFKNFQILSIPSITFLDIDQVEVWKI